MYKALYTRDDINKLCIRKRSKKTWYYWGLPRYNNLETQGICKERLITAASDNINRKKVMKVTVWIQQKKLRKLHSRWPEHDWKREILRDKLNHF